MIGKKNKGNPGSICLKPIFWLNSGIGKSYFIVSLTGTRGTTSYTYMSNIHKELLNEQIKELCQILL